MKYKNYLLCILFLSSWPITAQVVVSDSLALVDIYNKMGGTNWDNQVNWLSNNLVSTWGGVEVENGRVVMLDLSANTLVDTIPSSINELDNLMHLNLRSNQILALPDSLSLPVLEDFDCGNNSLTKITTTFDLPVLFKFVVDVNDIEYIADLSGMPNLNILRCEYNQVLGSLSDLSVLPNLVILLCHENSLDSLVGLGACVNLEYLQTNVNPLSYIPDLSDLTNLEEFYSINTDLTSIPGLENLTQLTDLNLSGNEFTVFPDMSTLVNLKFLSLNNNSLTEVHESIAKLKTVETIWISFNEITELPVLDSLINIKKFNFQYNQLTEFPELPNSDSLIEIRCFNNNFTFEDLEQFFDVPDYENVSLTYSPQNQDSTTIFGPIGAFYDSLVVFTVPIDGDSTTYHWYQDSVLLIADDSTDNILNFTTESVMDAGAYDVRLTHPFFDQLTISSNVHDVEVFGIDSVGGIYIPNQLMVEFDDNTTDTYRDSIRNLLHATMIDSCQCGQILQLWEFDSLEYYALVIPDSLGDLQFFHDPNEIKDKVKEEFSCVDNADFNYFTAADMSGATSVSSFPYRKNQQTSTAVMLDTVLIALIDTGIKNDFGLSGHIAQNPEEDGFDADGNCLIDTAGYDFVSGLSPSSTDNNDHASAMASIIKNTISPGTLISFLNLKAFNEDGKGELFDAVCAIHYALDRDIEVMNLSWSYRGLPVRILENALLRAGTKDVIVLASAGNGIDGIGQNLASVPFYPAAFEMDHLITVAALDGNELTPFSNYSDSLVQVAAPGWMITPWPGADAGNGTSQATAIVSGLVASYRSYLPDFTATEVKTALFDALIPLDNTSGDSLVWGGMVDVLQVQLENTMIDCTTGEGATAGLTAKGGFPPYATEWSNGQTSSEIDDLEADIYTVTLTDAVGYSFDGMVEIDSCIIDAISTIHLQKNELRLYPNPVRQNLTLDLAQGLIYTIEIINTHGDIIFRDKSAGRQSVSIVLDSLATGVYLVKCYSDNQVLNNRFIKLE